jgi:glycosyltransferase involved in cell wall biosynthesis
VRVAIDGQFRSLPPSGTGAYLRFLTAALPAAAPDIEWTVIDPAEDRHWPRHVRILPGAVRNEPRFRRFNWEALGFSKAAERLGGFDLLHIPSMAAPLRSRIPLVVTVHDAIPFALPEYRASKPMRAHLTLMRRNIARATLVLTPSKAAALDLVSLLGLPAGKIRVTPEAADPSCTPDSDAAALESVKQRFGVTGPFCFNIGGLDVRKRVDLLVEAFARALPDLPAGSQLVIGGKAHSGNPVVYPPIEPVIDRFGVRDRVILTGWLSEAEKIALYQAATVYATPSIYEGFGLTALEAMACGTPVIAANRTSLPEVVGDAGILVEPDAPAITEALIRTMNDDALRDDLRARGLEQASRFSWAETARLTAAAYREAVELTAKPE